MEITGNVEKMHVRHADPVHYALPVGGDLLDLNPLLQTTLSIRYLGEIKCHYCGRISRKSFNQGYCYPCSQRLARCDMCIVRPERCHYDRGTCREPEWGEQHCMQPHVVYLANSSGLKVGITRQNQLPTRWIDQGAVQALPVIRVQSRFHSGLVETALAEHVSDKTNWRAMLKGNPPGLDLIAERERLLDACTISLAAMEEQHGGIGAERSNLGGVESFRYPVLSFPSKIIALNLDKTPEVSGTLLGIKGQYLILDTGVLNVRKYTGYRLRIAF